mmetsp:Transcript_49462/g.116566  ORF Transcript_49462/g.116566 Transcript_49462/m.116566 type:complete len:156 (-) Transcript_49462:17-484(-)
MSCIAEEAQQQPIHGQQAVTFVFLNSNGIDDSKAARVAEALPQLTAPAHTPQDAPAGVWRETKQWGPGLSNAEGGEAAGMHPVPQSRCAHASALLLPPSHSLQKGCLCPGAFVSPSPSLVSSTHCLSPARGFQHASVCAQQSERRSASARERGQK